MSTLRTTWTNQSESPLPQDAYVVEDIQYRDHKYPIQPTEDEADELEDCNEITMSIRKKRNEIVSISQTLNYSLIDATKPGSEHTQCTQPNQDHNHTK
eukprot:1959971-Amphidinium_carterae.1